MERNQYHCYVASLLGLIKKQLGLPGEVEVRDAAEDSAIDKNNRRATGAPGRAVIVFYAKDSTE